MVVREAIEAENFRGAEKCCGEEWHGSSAAVASADSLTAGGHRRVPCALPPSGGDITVFCIGTIDSCGNGIGNELTVRLFFVDNY